MNDTEKIIRLERAFWENMANGADELSLPMLTEQKVIVGPMGALVADPATFLEMARANRPHRFIAWDMRDAQVIFSTPDTALIVYTSKQVYARDGEPDIRFHTICAGWVRIDGLWKSNFFSEMPAID